MEQIPWYQSAIIRQQIIALVAAIVGLLGLTSEIDVSGTVTAVLAGIAAVVPVWTIITRLTKAHPPLTDGAAQKEDAVQAKLKQGGFARIGLMLALVAVSGLVACTGLRHAWQAADTVDEQAYVLAEQYASLVKEAADLAQLPTTPQQAKDAMKAADAKAKPVVLKLKSLRDAYVAVDSAPNEEALQKAVNDAVLLIADLVRAVKQAKGET
jgi:hypothetical protein